MTMGDRTKGIVKAMLIGSFGFLFVELLQPVEAQAESCTIDPLGGEVCLPDVVPNDSGDDEDSPKHLKRVVIMPLCFGPCTQFPQHLPTASSLSNRNPWWNRNRLNQSVRSG